MLAQISLSVASCLGVVPSEPAATPAVPVVIRVATFNLEDVRSSDLVDGSNPRLKRLAEVIQRIRPNVILLNEIAFDPETATPAADGTGGASAGGGKPAGSNGQRFAEFYLAVAQAPDVAPLRMRAFMAPVNTGLFSGFDLDNDGTVTSTYPTPRPSGPDGSPAPLPPAEQAAARAYGGDCWGFGTFPGQYGMALLVDERLTIDLKDVRTFQMFPWSFLEGAITPKNPDGTEFYSTEEFEQFRLSSKSHWDVPVILPNGAKVHFLCSHPTPPAFDGPEQRNKRRNHDEIRFWRDYIENSSALVDDAGIAGGLATRADGRVEIDPIPFVVLGDLNADPEKGNSFRNPMKTFLLGNRHVNADLTPSSPIEIAGLTPSDTARFKLRVDYVLPSKLIRVREAGVWRQKPSGAVEFPSDHFPVWMEIEVPAPKPKVDPGDAPETRR
jgi:endonuclease/exonuclease/phosphatase family metal-dependent hydrolase